MTQASKNIVGAMAGLAVAGGLLAYAYFGVQKGEERELERKSVDERIFNAAAKAQKPADGGTADVQYLSLDITAKGETTQLERKDGSWSIVSPVKSGVDRFVVDGITSQLTTGKVREQLEAKPSNEELSKYGLAQPKFVAKAKAQLPDGNTVALKINGGIENPFDGSVYVQRDDDPAVYVADGALRSALEKSTFELRDKEIFNLDEAKVDKLSVVSAEGSYALVRNEKTEWQLVSPVQALADADAVRTALSSLRGERAQAFLDDSPDRRQALGLEAPANGKPSGPEVTLSLGQEVVRIRFAEGKEDHKSYALVERPAGSVLAEVQPAAAAALAKRSDELKDKTILRFEKDAVSSLTIHASEQPQPIVLRRLPAESDGGTAERWELTSPTKGPAKIFKVASILWSLGAVKATAFASDKAKDVKALGFSNPSLKVDLQDASGKPLASLIQGAEVPGKEAIRYVRNGEGKLFEVDASRLADLPPKLEELLDLPAADAGSGGSAADPGAP